MRWTQTSFDHRDWHPWFAWRPVLIYGEWVWLERVERRATYTTYDEEWHYRLPYRA